MKRAERFSTRLSAIAAGTIAQFMKLSTEYKIPGGVWRRYCPLCRGEFLPNNLTCKRCTEKIAETVADFDKSVKELMGEEGMDRPTAERKILQDKSETRNRHIWEIWNTETDPAKAQEKAGLVDKQYRKNYKMISATILKRQIDKKVEGALKDVSDPAERMKIEKEIRDNIPEGMKSLLDIAVAKLPEPEEVKPTYTRKLQDYIHREKARGHQVTTTRAAAKVLGFGDNESFITYATANGIKPVMALDVPGGVPTDMPEMTSVREPVLRNTPKYLHYAAWEVSDIKKLRQLLKRQHGEVDLDEQLKEASQKFAAQEKVVLEVRRALQLLDILEKSHPERISEIQAQRFRKQKELASAEQKLAKVRDLLDDVRDRIAKLSGPEKA